MEANFTIALDDVLRHEGGFVDHPSDPGGATNRGITLTTYRRWLKPDATVHHLRRISDAEVKHIYRVAFWNAVRASEMPSGVDYALFDWAVLAGPLRAAKHLQIAVDVDDDGIIGPVTMAAVDLSIDWLTIMELTSQRLLYLTTRSHWPTFSRGWTRRAVQVMLEATGLLDPSEKNTPPDLIDGASDAAGRVKPA